MTSYNLYFMIYSKLYAKHSQKYCLGFDRSKHTITDKYTERCKITIDGYTYASNTWGNSFHKTYEAMNYHDAKAQCESDGAFLAIPRSDDENAFIARLLPNENIWIGLNDIDKEGIFVAVDGQDVSYTKWLNGEPNNLENEDGVEILADRQFSNGYWNDAPIKSRKKFVCLFNIESPSK